MRLSAQGYTIREYAKTFEDIVKSLEKLKEIGYDALQISGFGQFDAKELKVELDRLGMTVCATHTPLADIVDKTDEVIERHKTLGIKYVGIGMYIMETIDECDEFIEKIKPAMKKIRQSGLKLLYHNHAHEFIKDKGERIIEHLLRNTDEDELGLIVDFYWVQRAGYPPEKFLKENAKRIPIVHFKDMRAVMDYNEKPQYMEIFEGNMDYDTIYEECLKAGVEWVAIEQDFCDGNPFDSLQLSLENMRKHKMFNL